MRLQILIGSILLAFQALSYSAEVTSQSIELNTSAQVAAVNGGISSLDSEARANQGIGNRAFESRTEASLEGVMVVTEATFHLRRTNTPTSDSFWVESIFGMHSEDLLIAATTQLVTRASASMNLSFQMRSATPFHYSIASFGQLPPALPGSSGVSIRTANGNAVLDLTWFSGTDNQSTSEGNLPAGDYQIRIFNNSTVEGAAGPTFENPIEGTTRSTVALTITPSVSPHTATPTLTIRRGPGDLILVEMTNLQAGTSYLVERAEHVSEGFWQYVANFTAAGPTASWSENRDPNLPIAFYRLRF